MFDFIIKPLTNPEEFFAVSTLSMLCAAFASLFFVLVVIYSIRSMKGHKGLFKYYIYLTASYVAALGVLFANNWIILLLFWGFLGLLLYLLIAYGKRETTPDSARKALILIGGTDVLLLFGIVLLWRITAGDSGLAGLLTMNFGVAGIDSTNATPAIIAYVCMAAAAFAKAGAMPFHTWVPDTAEDAPASVTAFLPASLDKLLGIYFLARISLEVFSSLFTMFRVMNTILMALGAVTILGAVMMALIQKDLKRLLGYHAVSQVGYMVLGIGTGNPIGIAGGIFHMFNCSIYNSCLFLSAGAAERKAGTSDLTKMGGLIKSIPLVFVTFLIGSLAISGIPPINGFASKWLVYQGIIEMDSGLSILWLVIAMIGSALTLAAFMKVVNAVFLGQQSEEIKARLKTDTGGTGFLTGLPISILAFLAVGIGVFANTIIPFFNEWFRGLLGDKMDVPGVWDSGLATGMILIGLVIGFIVYLLGNRGKVRMVDPFVGGEKLANMPDMRVSGVRFYDTFRNLCCIKTSYKMAEKKLCDIYHVVGKFVGGIGVIFSLMHNGLLSRYILWLILGLVVLGIILI